jgi:hypothetical protein
VAILFFLQGNHRSFISKKHQTIARIDYSSGTNIQHHAVEMKKTAMHQRQLQILTKSNVLVESDCTKACQITGYH